MPFVVLPSPKPPTNSLRIDRFLRPFTLKAVQELLSKTGSITSFWMDHIKTHCYVTVRLFAPSCQDLILPAYKSCIVLKFYYRTQYEVFYLLLVNDCHDAVLVGGRSHEDQRCCLQSAMATKWWAPSYS